MIGPEKNRAIGRDVISCYRERDVGFCAGTPLVPDDGALLFELFADILQRSRRNKEKGLCLPGDGISSCSSGEAGKPHIVMRHHIPESPFQEADRIPPHLVNFESRMPPLKSAQADLQRNKIARGLFPRRSNRHRGGAGAGASDIQRPLLLRIEVDEHTSGDQRRVEGRNPIETGFFIHGEEEFHRTMDERGVRHHRHHRSDTDAVIGSEGRPVRHHIVPIADHPDRLLVKIVHDIVPFFAHHVEMTLQDHARRLFLPRRSGKMHDEVSRMVAAGRQLLCGGGIQNELRNLLLFP